MATETFKELAKGQLAASSGLLYTAPAATTVLINQIVLVNTDSSDRTAQLDHTNGGAAAAGDELLPSSTIVAGGHAEGGGFIMDAGDKIYGSASIVNKVTYHIYGLELS